MSYTNSESGFYHMRRKGTGFENIISYVSVADLKKRLQENASSGDLEYLERIFQDDVPKDELKAILKDFSRTIQKERERFWEIFSFRNSKSYSEIKNILYLKPVFIVSKEFRKEKEPFYADILDSLLADQDSLFTSNDEHYRHEMLNDNIIKDYNKVYRNREKCINSALLFLETSNFSKEEQQIYADILKKFSEQAAEKHKGLQHWVQRRFPDDLTCKEKITILQAMFPEFHISVEFGRKFFDLVLNSFITKYKMESESKYRPQSLGIATDVIPACMYAYFKARLLQLQLLRHSAAEQSQSHALNLGYIRFFSFDVSQSINSNDSIAEAIRDFFRHCEVPLKENRHDYLRHRITWALQQSIPVDLQPTFLTLMVICCNQSITIGKEIPVIEQGPIYNPRFEKPKQRCAQLTLLEKLCDIFAVDGANRLNNWKEFLHWQGKEILSSKEVQFWRKRLLTDYEKLPEIGFQLCCLDYLQDCLPEHLEHLLSYSSNWKRFSLWKGGYSQNLFKIF